jgi:hypothetical protein
MKTANTIFAVVALVALAGCEHDLSLAERTFSPRPAQYLAPLPAPADSPAGRVNVVVDNKLDIKVVEIPVTGTYFFTTPSNVTQIKSTGSKLNAYQLFVGSPKPTDRPFLTIEIAPNITSEAEVGGILNGLVATEWTGKTADGYPFCELIITHGEKGDKLRALAIARDKPSRQLALDILGSIKWEAKKKEN